MPDTSYWRSTTTGTLVKVALKDNLDGTFSEATGTGGGGSGSISLKPDAVTGKLTGGRYTLASASTVVTINIPDFAYGLRLRPTADTRFAIGENPVAAGVDALTVGNTAYANETEVRLLDTGTGRTLRLLTSLAGSTVGVSFF